MNKHRCSWCGKYGDGKRWFFNVTCNRLNDGELKLKTTNFKFCHSCAVETGNDYCDLHKKEGV